MISAAEKSVFSKISASGRNVMHVPVSLVFSRRGREPSRSRERAGTPR